MDGVENRFNRLNRFDPEINLPFLKTYDRCTDSELSHRIHHGYTAVITREDGKITATTQLATSILRSVSEDGTEITEKHGSWTLIGPNVDGRIIGPIRVFNWLGTVKFTGKIGDDGRVRLETPHSLRIYDYPMSEYDKPFVLRTRIKRLPWSLGLYATVPQEPKVYFEGQLRVEVSWRFGSNTTRCLGGKGLFPFRVSEETMTSYYGEFRLTKDSVFEPHGEGKLHDGSRSGRVDRPLMDGVFDADAESFTGRIGETKRGWYVRRRLFDGYETDSSGRVIIYSVYDHSTVVVRQIRWTSDLEKYSFSTMKLDPKEKWPTYRYDSRVLCDGLPQLTVDQLKQLVVTEEGAFLGP